MGFLLTELLTELPYLMTERGGEGGEGWGHWGVQEAWKQKSNKVVNIERRKWEIGEEGVRAEEKQEVVTMSDKEKMRGAEKMKIFAERNDREHILWRERERDGDSYSYSRIHLAPLCLNLIEF